MSEGREVEMAPKWTDSSINPFIYSFIRSIHSLVSYLFVLELSLEALEERGGLVGEHAAARPPLDVRLRPGGANISFYVSPGAGRFAPLVPTRSSRSRVA